MHGPFVDDRDVDGQVGTGPTTRSAAATPASPRLRVALTALLGIGLIGAAGCTPGTGYSAACSATGPVGIGVGDQAPPLCGTTLDGGTVTVTSFEGKPVLVNFWASWCGPCRDEFPLFKAALVAHPDLVIVGVVYQDQPANARTFAGSFGAGWPSLIDPDGALARAYKVVAPPQSYFIDRSGAVRSRQIGVLTGPDLERQFAAIGG